MVRSKENVNLLYSMAKREDIRGIMIRAETTAVDIKHQAAKNTVILIKLHEI